MVPFNVVGSTLSAATAARRASGSFQWKTQEEIVVDAELGEVYLDNSL